MPAVTTQNTDAAIVEAALNRGYADCQVIRQSIPDRWGVEDSGVWFYMFVKNHGSADWQIVGRRRTKQELFALVQRGPLDYRDKRAAI